MRPARLAKNAFGAALMSKIIIIMKKTKGNVSVSVL
jgi:hypothetical protein